MKTMILRALLICLSTFVCASTQPAVAKGFHAAREFKGHGDAHDTGQAIGIPIIDQSGHKWTMQGRLCLPRGIDKPRLVVINHGSPARADDRPRMSLDACDAEYVEWFLHRHYAVALALRLGYGATGGPWTEGYDGCERADYYHSGLETARQINTIVDAVATLTSIDSRGVIVLGQSAGGWGTLAYDSINHPHVLGFINMAGGRGGHYHDKPDNNCHPEKLIEAAAMYGKTSTTPMLWIYTKNDSFFNPELSAAMYQAFNQAGGKAELVNPGSFDGDGHHLFVGHGGTAIWGPAVESYLGKLDPSSQP